MAKVIGNNHKKQVEKRQQARYRKKYLKKSSHLRDPSEK